MIEGQLKLSFVDPPEKQILSPGYLQDNPLLEAPLRLEHIKPRLLGHWGTKPGLNFLYVHLPE